MGDLQVVPPSSNRLELRVRTSKKFPISSLIGVAVKDFSLKTSKRITSIKQGLVSFGAAGEIGLFLLTTAALEAFRKLSLSHCPLLWHGLQALQLLCYPPLKWIQRWSPFKGLVKNMQMIQKPMLALSIATIFSEESISANGMAEGLNNAQSSYTSSRKRLVDQVPKSLVSEEWFIKLCKELGEQGIYLPERFRDDDLRRFYAVSEGDFSKLLSSVKKTICWRQSYSFFKPEELEAWAHLVFWHGSDEHGRPCLIIRVGLACSQLDSKGRSLFVKAIVSQIEHGVVNLINVEHPQFTVLMDCDGLSPFGFPVQMMRSCAVLLQDHYPNRLGCLLVTRLPAVARVITQALFQVLRPKTRQKMRIIGRDRLGVLSTYFKELPPFLGGSCSCSKCSGGHTGETSEVTEKETDETSEQVDKPAVGRSEETEKKNAGTSEEIDKETDGTSAGTEKTCSKTNGETSRIRPTIVLPYDMNISRPFFNHRANSDMDTKVDKAGNFMKGVLVLCIFLACIWAMYFPDRLL